MLKEHADINHKVIDPFTWFVYSPSAFYFCRVTLLFFSPIIMKVAISQKRFSSCPTLITSDWRKMCFDDNGGGEGDDVGVETVGLVRTPSRSQVMVIIMHIYSPLIIF